MSGENDIVRVSCATEGCGTFPMDRALNERLKKSGDTFTCPAGHRQSYGESTEDKLRQQIRELKQRLEAKQESVDDWYQHFDAEQQERKKWERAYYSLLSRFAERINGIVEIEDDAGDEYIWVCECGSHAQRPAENKTTAWNRYDQHRSNVHSDGQEAEA